jgi:hypothetical protein
MLAQQVYHTATPYIISPKAKMQIDSRTRPTSEIEPISNGTNAHLFLVAPAWNLCLEKKAPGRYIVNGEKATARRKKTMTRKILIIGNSHSVDAFHHLCGAFRDQNPGAEVVTGVAYYSGCSITQHVDFHKNNQAVYGYYKNDNGAYSVT